MDPPRTVAAVDRTVFKSRRVAVGLGAVSVLCGAAAIIMNFGILDRTQREPVGNFVQTISNRGARQDSVAVPSTGVFAAPTVVASTTTTQPSSDSNAKADANDS